MFLTSYNKECIDAFVTNVLNADDFSFHALVPSDDRISVRKFTDGKFQGLLEARNVDLRRAQ